MAAKKKAKPASGSTAASAVCERCGGYGYYLDEGNIARPCDCGMYEQVVRRGSRVRNSGIPVRFMDKELDTFQHQKGDRTRAQIVQAARAYARSFRKDESEGLLLRGKPGSGKTHIAVGILKEVLRRGFTGHYTNFNDLLSRLRDSYNRGSLESEAELLAEMEESDLLVLDDVGAESATNWVRDRLYLIVNRRYESARALLVTTNCGEEQLRAHVGERTASRLYEMCSQDFPLFPDQDYRLANLR